MGLESYGRAMQTPETPSKAGSKNVNNLTIASRPGSTSSNSLPACLRLVLGSDELSMARSVSPSAPRRSKDREPSRRPSSAIATSSFHNGSSSRSGSTNAGKSIDKGMAAPTEQSASDGQVEAEKQNAPKVARILSVQQTEGVGKTYLCVLQGSGKKVQVRSATLERHAEG